METVTFGSKTYNIDAGGYLLDFRQWDANFATNMAPKVNIISGLTDKHWELIKFVRAYVIENGKCPVVYQTCRTNNMRIKELKELFPTGYMRGLCKLAGITYKEGYHGHTYLPQDISGISETDFDTLMITKGMVEKTYTIDGRGFLIDVDQWDEQFALLKANEMKIPGGLTKKHWDIILYVRKFFKTHGFVPTIYDLCETYSFDIDNLEQLFPDGYHRGAIKISGLRVR